MEANPYTPGELKHAVYHVLATADDPEKGMTHEEIAEGKARARPAARDGGRGRGGAASGELTTTQRPQS